MTKRVAGRPTTCTAFEEDTNMADRLKEKIALVFGAGSCGPGWGNGKATAVLYAREGAKVAAVDKSFAAAVDREQIKRGAQELGLSLDEHVGMVLEAMQSVAEKLGL